MLKTIAEEEINVEYMYGLTIKGDMASIVMKTDDLDKASKAFGL